MSVKNLLNHFFIQYPLSYLSLLLLTYLSSCFDGFVSLVGKIIVLSFISWHLTKRIRKRLNKEVLTSFKRAVLVTGCDSGFGNALAFKLNENGFRVYATVLDPESDGAKKLMTGSRFDGKTHVLKMDITSDEEIQSVYEHVKNDLKQNGEQLWAVVNNAGLVTYGPFDWGTIDTYKKIFEVNTFGMVRVTRTFLPLLRQSKGRIVNLVSMAGRSTSPNLPGYSMSKHAAISFSDAIRRELKKYGIRVSTVEPMAYATQMCAQDFFEREIDRIWNESSEDVKHFYGQEYVNNLKQRSYTATVHLKPGENINEVVDLLLEAVRSPDPQIRYVAIANGLFIRSMFNLLLRLPMEIQDFCLWIKESRAVKPAYFKNEE